MNRSYLAFLIASAVSSAILSSALGQGAAPAPLTLTTGWTLQDVVKVEKAGDTPAAKKAEADAWGAKLSMNGATQQGWYKATVPGTVLTSLVNDGVYPEPLYGENNRPDKIPESLCRTSYWYRTDVAVPADYAGKRIWLNFDGINYTADVWVNGKQAGTVKGAFARGIFDVTDFVKAGQPAAIAVRINPPLHPGNPLEQTVANGTGGNGGAIMQDGATFGCTVGWDWIPGIRDRDMGLWQKVTLSTTGPVRIDDPSVSSDLPLPKTDTAELMVLTTVRNATDAPQTGTLKGTFEGGSFSVPVTLQPKETKEVKVTTAEAAQLHVVNPKLWWPNTYGEPYLYNLHVTFDVNGAQSDAKDANFGIRKITYQVPKDETRIPQTDNLTIYVNGVPIFCKGGAWGMDEAMKRIPREVMEAKVRFHALANYNMIRNWVGQSTGEEFYAQCDKYGIMIWDEMFQANASDGPQVGGNPAATDTPEILAWRKETIDMYLANVREKVLRFRSHPSIALWCGRNESYPAPKEVADGVTKLTAELDPARFYQANSGDGRGVRSGGPYSWRVPSAYFAPVAGAAGAANARPLEAFKTELGGVSIPTLAFIKAWMPEKDWYDLNDDWASHDLLSGAQQGNTFPLGMATRYGFIAQRDLVDFVRKSQMAMYETWRAEYEGRAAKLFDPCAGVLAWMSNPSQPSFVWQVYSYDNEPLAALYGAKKGCEPLHVQLNGNDWHIMVVNTLPQAKDALQVVVRIFNMDGTQKSEKTLPVSAKAFAATDLGMPAWPEGLTPVHYVKLELKDAAGKVISDNFYWRTTATISVADAPKASEIFGSGGAAGRGARGGGGGSGGGGPGRGPATSPPAEDFSALQTLPTADVQVTLNRHDAGGKCLIDATISNPTKIPALQAHLTLRKQGGGERVLPVYYSDNYISLLPGESKTVTIEAGSAALGGGMPEVAVDGWNISTAAKSFPAGGGAAVALNKDAFVGPKTAAPARGN
jgi:beta-mannosidase